MTLEELRELRFRMESHMAIEDAHIASYINDDYGFIMQVSTKKKNEFEFGRSTRHFIYKGKRYRSLPKFLEAIKDIQYDKTRTGTI